MMLDPLRRASIGGRLSFEFLQCDHDYITLDGAATSHNSGMQLPISAHHHKWIGHQDASVVCHAGVINDSTESWRYPWLSKLQSAESIHVTAAVWSQRHLTLPAASLGTLLQSGVSVI